MEVSFPVPRGKNIVMIFSVHRAYTSCVNVRVLRNVNAACYFVRSGNK